MIRALTYGKFGKIPFWPVFNFLATAPIGVAAGAGDLFIGPGFAQFPPFGVV